jgi:peptidyl-Asp metalloendopeptidase
MRAAACVVLGASLAAASHAQAKPAFEVAAKGAAVSFLPAHAKPGSGVRGRVAPAAFEKAHVTLPLPDGTVILARRERLERSDRFGATTWLGTFADAPGDSLLVTVQRGVVTGSLTRHGADYEIITDSAGMQVLYAVDPARLPPLEPDELPRADLSAEELAANGLAYAPALPADLAPVVQDLLVTYTAASRQRWGASLEGRILNAVARANQAYANSRVGITLNLVGIEPAGVAERPTATLTHAQMRTSTSIGATRDRLGADLVVLVGENEDVCGTAWMMTSNSTSHERWAHGYVAATCLGGRTLAHEIGHLQGLDHDRVVSPTSRGVYSYGTGYASCTRDGAAFYDLMSYGCSPGYGAAQLQQFSNPRLDYRFKPTGVAHESDPARSADAARALNATAATVAGYRASRTAGPGVPLAPTAVMASSGSVARVLVRWSHPGGSAAGFMVLRSADGLQYAEVARLGGSASSYVDDGVQPGTVYAYRVRAYNSNGVSADSATAVVTAQAGARAASRRDVERAQTVLPATRIDALARPASRR